MAFEADCGGSTVLDKLRVATTARFHVPAASCGPPDEALRNSGVPTRGSKWKVQVGGGLGGNSKLKTKNSKLLRWVDGRKNPKSEIRNPKFLGQPS